MKRASLLIACLTFLLIANLTQAQVTANFTANNTEGCGSLQVSFTDLSTSSAGSIVSWSWDLAGVQSSNQNPGRIYGTPGSYTICLTVTDSDGNTDTECKSNFIRVLHLPDPDFEAIPAQGCAPLDVVFQDQSNSIDGNITQWIWGLGGSTGVIIDNGQNPPITSTYALVDEYSITLTVKDDNGCSNTVTKSDYVVVSPDPVVNFTVSDDFSCTAPFVVTFQNTGDTDDMNFFWDFDNGFTFSGTTPPAVAYTDPGTYCPTLIGTNAITGCSDTMTLSNCIQVGYPIDFSVSTNEGCRDLTVNFTDNSPNTASEVIWDFGNGDSSTVANTSYTYTQPGCYTVSLTRNVNGCITTVYHDQCIDVFDLPDVNYANTNPMGCTVPHTVEFIGFSNDAVAWVWDFGNGDSSTLQNPIYTYEELGFYNVTLTVVNDFGCTSTVDYQQIGIQSLNADIPSGQIEGCTPLDVTLTDNSSTIVPILNWEWEVIYNSSTPPLVQTSNDAVPTFTLVDTGFYDVRLVVTNQIGCVDTTYFTQRIAVGMPPTINMDADPNENCVETVISFFDQSSDYANSWRWEFGDGAVTEEQNPEHEYADTGYYDITLTAWHHGCINFETFENFILINPPKAAFSVNRDCETPYYIELVDMSIGADSIFWDFGVPDMESDTTSEANPVFTFPDRGTYTITMQVFNFEEECEDDETFTLTITDPVAQYDLGPMTGCAPHPVFIDNNSIDANEYSWTAPGAVISDPTIREPVLTYNNDGIYSDIELIITDINGCQDTMLVQDSIWVNDIDVQYALDPTGGCRPLTVSFTDQSTTTFGNNIAWDWYFDGAIANSSEQNPVLTFPENGLIDVRLTVENDWGCIKSLTVQDQIEVTYPSINFTADTYGCTEHEISFNNASTGKALTYLWDFGDNTTSTAANPTHLYTAEGVYSVCLTATDFYGCDSTFCREDYIVIADPVAAFTADTTYATCPPLLVNFTNESLHANTFNWNFGDGSGNSELENPPHLYSAPGEYDVMLIASSTAFCHDTLVLPEYIEIDGPIGDLAFDIDSACVPAVITFTGESLDAYNYIWDFGNGVLDSTLNVSTDTIMYTYEEVGRYVPKLILVDNMDCAIAYESPDTIQIERLDIDFQVTDQLLCTGESQTSFINLTFSTVPIEYLEWITPGADVPTTTQSEPMLVYDTVGLFDVSLIIDNGFCRDTLQRPEQIRVGETPVADFAMSGDIGCAPYVVNFTDASTVGTGAITEWDWTYSDGDDSQLQNPTHVFDELGEHTIELAVTTDIGCSDTTSQSLEVLPMPEVEFADNHVICMGQTVQLVGEVLTDPTGLDFNWIPDPALNCTNCLEPWASPLDTTTFYLIVSNAIGCADTTAVTVNVRPFPAPVVESTSDTTICANEVVQLMVSGGNDIYEYQWDTSAEGLSCYDDCFNPVASPTETTMYVVAVTNQYECQTLDSITVEVIDQFQPFAGPDRTICEDASIQLDASFGNDPVWTVSDGLSCSYCPTPIASPEETVTYVVQVTTDIGCEVIDSITVNVMTDEDVSAGPDLMVCEGESIQLEAKGEGTITWTPATDLDNATIIRPMASPSNTQVYTLTVTNDECTITDDVEITVATRAEIQADAVTICNGESIELRAYGIADEYEWLPEEGITDLNVANPVVNPTETTTYTVIGKLRTCEEDTIQVTVTVIQGPEIYIPPVYDFLPGQTVQMEVDVPEVTGYTYEWSPAEPLTCISCANPEITPDSTQAFAVEVTDPNTGCTSRAETIVAELTDCPEDLINVPNIFTPNNDGVNDALDLHLSPSLFETGIYSFRIFDRWGATVFETSDYTETWDGTLKGKNLPSGVFIYLIEAPCPITGGQFMKTGDITLLR